MSVDDGIVLLEAELAELEQRWTATRAGECVACYVNRMVVDLGCTRSLRWTRRWREARAPRATALLRRLRRSGARCDCDLFTVVWDLTVETVRGPDDLEWWPESVQGCAGVRTGSAQPCALWTRQRRR